MRQLIPGLLFVAIISACAIWIDTIPTIHALGLGAKILGLGCGVLLANLLPLPALLHAGTKFTTKTLLRIAIILLGLKITLFDIIHVGPAGVMADAVMAGSTILLAILIGRLIKLDRDTTLLIGTGSAICGASAALATESMLDSPAYKAAMAVATVTIFGTLLMAVEPILFAQQLLPFTEPTTFGVYAGSTIHEVAQVVAAGFGVGTTTGETAVIVKLARVMMLAPLLFCLLLWLRSSPATDSKQHSAAVPFPWFVVGFIAVSVLHTYITLPAQITKGIVTLDDFLLTMAMVGLGLLTRLKDFRGVGYKPFTLGALLALWLLVGGIGVTHLATSVFGSGGF